MPQLEYRTSLNVAIEGAAYDMTGRNMSALNVDPQAAQVVTITIDTATDDENYGVDFFDGAFSFAIDSGTGSSATSIAAALAAEINDDGEDAPFVNERVVATSAGADLIITARIPGVGFTVTLDENSAKMTLVETTANATADEVEFGLGVIEDGENNSSGVIEQVGAGTGFERLAKLAKAASLTAREVVLTPVVGEGTYIVDVTVEGTTYHGLYDTDGTATAAEVVDGIVASLNAQLPAETVLAANDTDTLKLTAELAGKDFSYSFGGSVAGTSWSVTSDNVAPETDINTALLGVARLRGRSERVKPETPGEIADRNAKYKANQVMTVNEDGRTWVVPEDTVTTASKVYIRLAADGSLDRLGGFSGSSGTGKALLTRASFFKVAGSKAVLELRD